MTDLRAVANAAGESTSAAWSLALHTRIVEVIHREARKLAVDGHEREDLVSGTTLLVVEAALAKPRDFPTEGQAAAYWAMRIRGLARTALCRSGVASFNRGVAKRRVIPVKDEVLFRMIGAANWGEGTETELLAALEALGSCRAARALRMRAEGASWTAVATGLCLGAGRQGQLRAKRLNQAGLGQARALLIEQGWAVPATVLGIHVGQGFTSAALVRRGRVVAEARVRCSDRGAVERGIGRLMNVAGQIVLGPGASGCPVGALSAEREQPTEVWTLPERACAHGRSMAELLAFAKVAENDLKAALF